MKKAFAMMLALSLAILTGCGAADAEVSPTPVPSPPVQEYAESDPITVTVTPVELSEEQQEIAYLSSRIGDEVHMYELETEGKITARWRGCSAWRTAPGYTARRALPLTWQRAGSPS